MKNVKIYSIGHCDTSSRKGRYEALLEYNENRKYLIKEVNDTTANRCIIIGLIDSVSSLKEPCAIELITTTKIGLRGLSKGKGPNVDLLKKLMDTIQEKGCEFEFVELEGKGAEINAKIQSYSSAN